MYKKRCMGCMAEITTDKCEICGYVKGEAPAEPYQLFPGTIISESYIVGRTIYYDDIETTYIGYDIKNACKVIIKEFFPVKSASREPGEGTVSLASDSGKHMTQFREKCKLIACAYREQNLEINFTELSCNNTSYVIYNPVMGKTLADYIKENPITDFKEAENIIQNVMDDLEFVHKTGLCHLSITPESVLLAPGNNIKVIGFEMGGGIIKSHSEYWVRRNEDPDKIISSSSSYSGKIKENSDVFSIAALFYKMMTKIGISTTAPDGNVRVKPFADYGIELPDNINAAIINALEPSSEYRTKTISKLRNQLESTTTKLNKVKNKSIFGAHKMLAITGIVLASAVLIYGLYAFSEKILGNAPAKVESDTDAVQASEKTENTESLITVGMSIEEATKAVTAAGKTLEVYERKYDEQLSDNSILDVKEIGESVVKVRVNARLYSVPDLKGVSEKEAKEILERAGFKVERKEKKSNDYDSDTVISTDKDGQALEVGAVVTITVAKPEPASKSNANTTKKGNNTTNKGNNTTPGKDAKVPDTKASDGADNKGKEPKTTDNKGENVTTEDDKGKGAATEGDKGKETEKEADKTPPSEAEKGNTDTIETKENTTGVNKTDVTTPEQQNQNKRDVPLLKKN